MLSSLDKLSSNLGKDKFRKTRKRLESFHIQLPNQPQINDVTEVGKEGKVMDVYEGYQNHPYQPPILMPDQQQQIEKDLALMTRKEVYPYKYVDSFEWTPFDSFLSYHPKTPSIAH